MKLGARPCNSSSFYFRSLFSLSIIWGTVHHFILLSYYHFLFGIVEHALLVLLCQRHSYRHWPQPSYEHQYDYQYPAYVRQAWRDTCRKSNGSKCRCNFEQYGHEVNVLSYGKHHRWEDDQEQRKTGYRNGLHYHVVGHTLSVYYRFVITLYGGVHWRQQNSERGSLYSTSGGTRRCTYEHQYYSQQKSCNPELRYVQGVKARRSRRDWVEQRT